MKKIDFKKLENLYTLIALIIYIPVAVLSIVYIFVKSYPLLLISIILLCVGVLNSITWIIVDVINKKNKNKEGKDEN